MSELIPAEAVEKMGASCTLQCWKTTCPQKLFFVTLPQSGKMGKPRAKPSLLHTSKEVRKPRPFTGVPAEGGIRPGVYAGLWVLYVICVSQARSRASSLMP